MESYIRQHISKKICRNSVRDIFSFWNTKKKYVSFSFLESTYKNSISYPIFAIIQSYLTIEGGGAVTAPASAVENISRWEFFY